MNILIAGGAGAVGTHLVRDLEARGHTIRIIDRSETAAQLKNAIQGDLSNAEVIREAVNGMDAIVNLAWSFSDDAATIFGEDLRGHAHLLEAACACRVKAYIYASTAVVYGRAVRHPVTEEHPCLIARARKPLYALGKVAAEELCAHYARTKGLATAVFRFWWAFGETIGGSNLRDLVRKALRGEPLEMVREAGGAFLTMPDFSNAVGLALAKPGVSGQIYNLGSLFLNWSEIGECIIAETASRSPVRFIAPQEWKGPAFLNEVWDLDWTKAKRELGYEPTETPDAIRERLSRALAHCVAEVKKVNG